MVRLSELLTASRALEPYLTALGHFVLAIETQLHAGQQFFVLGCAILLLASIYAMLTVEFV